MTSSAVVNGSSREIKNDLYGWAALKRISPLGKSLGCTSVCVGRGESTCAASDVKGTFVVIVMPDIEGTIVVVFVIPVCLCLFVVALNVFVLVLLLCIGGGVDTSTVPFAALLT